MPPDGVSGDALTVAAETVGSPDLPTSIASFKVIRLIGAGGMGAVYEAEQAMPRRTVALKVIRPGLVTPDVRRRFDTEVQVLGRLLHPGIARIYQAGVTDLGGGPQPYFAMELVSGLPLVDHAIGRGLGSRERLRLVASICDAVQHAHQRGVIHRDLKPGNILVDEASGDPKILDFGIARTTDPDLQMTSYTMFGQLVGTLPYMSPEQLTADPANVDTRSDVYALGVILYELLTGKLPHDLTRRSTIEAMSAIRDVEPTRLGSLDRRLRGDVETIVAKALEKEKDRRYASAAELAADIRRYLDDQPIVARPPSAAYQLRKFARRNKALVGGVAAALVILMAGVIASTWQAVRATRAERLAGTRLVEADQARTVAQTREAEATEARHIADQRRGEAEENFRIAEEARALAEQQREANRQLLYIADLNLAQRMWNEGNHPRVVELLERHRPAAGLPDLRGFEWFHLWRAAHLHERAFQLPSFVQAVDVAPDGELVAAADAAGNVGIWEVATGRARWTWRNPDVVGGIALSPDRRTIAIGGRVRTIRLVETDTGRERVTIDAGDGLIGQLAFASGGTVVMSSGARPRVWDAATGRELLSGRTLLAIPAGREAAALAVAAPDDVRLWSPSGERRLVIDGAIRNAAVSDDGTHVAIATATGRVTVWTLAGNQIASFQVDGSIAGELVLSAGGRLLAGIAQSAFAVWNVASGRIVATTPVPPGRNVDAAFSRDGTLLLLGGEHGVSVLDVAARRLRGTIRGHGTGLTRVKTSSDERRLITWTSDGVKTWDLSQAFDVDVITLPASQVTSLAASSDGRWAASTLRESIATAGSRQSTVALWDVASGTQAASRAIKSEGTAIVFAAADAVLVGDVSGNLSVVDVRRDAVPTIVKAHDQAVSGLAVSANRTRVASAAGNEVRVWDPAGWRLLDTVSHRGVSSVTFAPDGRRFASAGRDGLVRIWRGGSRTPAQVLRGQNDLVYTLAWSPEGLIASGDQSGFIVLWDATTGTLTTRLRAHLSRITSVSFSADGRRLLTSALDGAAKLWDVDTKSEVAHYTAPTFIDAAAFAPGGRAIVIASGTSIAFRRSTDR